MHTKHLADYFAGNEHSADVSSYCSCSNTRHLIWEWRKHWRSYHQGGQRQDRSPTSFNPALKEQNTLALGKALQTEVGLLLWPLGTLIVCHDYATHPIPHDPTLLHPTPTLKLMQWLPLVTAGPPAVTADKSPSCANNKARHPCQRAWKWLLKTIPSWNLPYAINLLSNSFFFFF